MFVQIQTSFLVVIGNNVGNSSFPEITGCLDKMPYFITPPLLLAALRSGKTFDASKP